MVGNESRDLGDHLQASEHQRPQGARLAAVPSSSPLTPIPGGLDCSAALRVSMTSSGQIQWPLLLSSPLFCKHLGISKQLSTAPWGTFSLAHLFPRAPPPRGTLKAQLLCSCPPLPSKASSHLCKALFCLHWKCFHATKLCSLSNIIEV